MSTVGMTMLVLLTIVNFERSMIWAVADVVTESVNHGCGEEMSLHMEESVR